LSRSHASSPCSGSSPASSSVRLSVRLVSRPVLRRDCMSTTGRCRTQAGSLRTFPWRHGATARPTAATSVPVHGYDGSLATTTALGNPRVCAFRVRGHAGQHVQFGDAEARTTVAAEEGVAVAQGTLRGWRVGDDIWSKKRAGRRRRPCGVDSPGEVLEERRWGAWRSRAPRRHQRREDVARLGAPTGQPERT
jgi:hypothetical protein